jgi:hypothetical protein
MLREFLLLSTLSEMDREYYLKYFNKITKTLSSFNVYIKIL